MLYTIKMSNQSTYAIIERVIQNHSNLIHQKYFDQKLIMDYVFFYKFIKQFLVMVNK
jgi:hypothetical protein